MPTHLEAIASGAQVICIMNHPGREPEHLTLERAQACQTIWPRALRKRARAARSATSHDERILFQGCFHAISGSRVSFGSGDFREAAEAQYLEALRRSALATLSHLHPSYSVDTIDACTKKYANPALDFPSPRRGVGFSREGQRRPPRQSEGGEETRPSPALSAGHVSPRSEFPWHAQLKSPSWFSVTLTRASWPRGWPLKI